MRWLQKYLFAFLVLPTLALPACETLETGTVLSLARLTPEDIDPLSGRVAVLWPDTIKQYRPPILTSKVIKDGTLLIDEKIQLETDPDAARFVPYPKDSGYLQVYKIAQKDLETAYKAQKIGADIAENSPLFGGPKWEITRNADFSFTVERTAFYRFCDGIAPLETSVWVKVNASRPYQRLIDQKAIDRIVSGQIKAECDKPDTNFITPE